MIRRRSSTISRIIIVFGATLLSYSAVGTAEPEIEARKFSPLEVRASAIESGKLGDRITGVGANKAPEGAYPWVVSVGVRKKPHTMGHFCGGVLINEFWVATAAHCIAKQTLVNGSVKFVPDDAKKIDVLVGSNMLNEGKVIGIQVAKIYPDYDVFKNVPIHDVALLKLESAIDNKRAPRELVKPEIAQRALDDPEESFLIAGWGRLSYGKDQPLSNDLLQAYVPIIQFQKCQSPDMYGSLLRDDMVCAGLTTGTTGVVDACQGDSGGPAILYVDGTAYLAGLVSWGYNCGDGKYPGVYVKMSSYRGWIMEQTR
jgi:secreted trypsin-like serine protease